MTNKEKYAGKFIDATYQYIKASNEGKPREEIISIVKPHTDRMLELAEKIANDGDEPSIPDPPNPNEPYEPPYTQAERDEVLAMPVWEEHAIHYMALPGYIYRNLNDNPKETKDKVYELVRQARIAGCKYVRTFLINGDRSSSEKYIMDALPWEMVKVEEFDPYGKDKTVKKIDYTLRNDYYFECCGVIEEACKYWKVHHMPTFYMDRYNYDVFDIRYNVNDVNGYRSEDALVVKCQFIQDYMEFQHEYRGSDYAHAWEIENEPFHHGDWGGTGATIADQNLEMFRIAEAHGALIDDTETCSGTSEFSHANFVEKHWMGGTANRYFGSAEFASRKVKPEYHWCSTIQGLLGSGWEHGLGSGWKHLCNNEDGGSGDGNYNPIPWTSYRQGDYDQVFDLCWYAITSAKAHGKRWYFTIFAMDCLEIDPVDGVAKETYTIENMNWHRNQAPRDVRLDLAN